MWSVGVLECWSVGGVEEWGSGVLEYCHDGWFPLLHSSSTPAGYMQNQEDFAQLQGRLFQLTNQIENMQWEIARLSRDTQKSNHKVDVLLTHVLNAKSQKYVQESLAELQAQRETDQEKMDLLLTHVIDAKNQRHVQERLIELQAQLESEQKKIDILLTHVVDSKNHKDVQERLAEFQTQLESDQERLDELGKTVKKLSRTQFKANTLSESKEQQVSETVTLLRELVTKRDNLPEAQREEDQQRIEMLQSNARSELAVDFLPVLDGIEMALEHKISLAEYEHEAQSKEEQTEPASGLLKKIFSASSHVSEKSLSEENRRLIQEIHKIDETLQGWVQGLEIVRERFLRLLAAEGIEPISDIGEQFDPHVHVAVETEKRPDVPENSIVRVLRKGYKLQDRVLRYSEVIVARAPQEEQE